VAYRDTSPRAANIRGLVFTWQIAENFARIATMENKLRVLHWISVRLGSDLFKQFRILERTIAVRTINFQSVTLKWPIFKQKTVFANLSLDLF
jgi:hypothetical protein